VILAEYDSTNCGVTINVKSRRSVLLPLWNRTSLLKQVARPVCTTWINDWWSDDANESRQYRLETAEKKPKSGKKQIVHVARLNVKCVLGLWIGSAGIAVEDTVCSPLHIEPFPRLIDFSPGCTMTGSTRTEQGEASLLRNSPAIISMRSISKIIVRNSWWFNYIAPDWMQTLTDFDANWSVTEKVPALAKACKGTQGQIRAILEHCL
jgi:hypothetical protein